jgi:hypothetical protein
MYPASYDTSDSPSIPKLAPDEVGKIKLTKKLCFFSHTYKEQYLFRFHFDF